VRCFTQAHYRLGSRPPSTLHTFMLEILTSCAF
jgi:hypothetical protein